MNGNPVRASRLRLVSLCALFLLIRTTVVNAQTEVCASYEPTQTQIQGSKSWCWAACLQFLYTVYGGSGFSQSLIAHRIVAYYCSDPLGTLPPAYGPWDPDIQCGEGAWCNQWPYDVCNDHDYTVSQLRTFMEWGESFWTGGIRDPRSLSSAALKDELCGGAYLLAAVGHEYTGLGHLVVVTKIDNTGGEANASIRFWDPESDDWFEPSLGSFRNNGNGNGPWVRFFRVEAYFGNPNSVADIQSFGVGSSGHNVNLSFEIQGGADPGEYAAIYVSDNPAGPALLIDALTNHAALMPSVNQWTDNLRLAPSDGYYYWMDYDDGPFASARSPVGLLAATGNPAYVTGTARPQFDPPIIQALEDIPLDHGGSLRITWLAPLGSENADGFNVYRRSYPPGQSALGEWRVIGSTNLSTPTIVDNGAATGWVNDYRVSVAHHGGYALQPGDGNLGIWNDFSAEGSGAPIDNFANSEITLVSSDTLRVCPAGDDGVLHVDESIWGNVGGPTVGVPPEWCRLCY